jgi:hypothetical protein
MRTMTRITLAAALAVAAGAFGAPAAETVLDYDAFKARIEPIFLKHRAGHARCYTCHAESNNAFHLERLPPGSSFWSEAQSRRNFEMVLGLVVPGDIAASKLLQHPLAPEAGGESYHSGGRQFPTKTDPDWKTLAQWVNGAKPPAR